MAFWPDLSVRSKLPELMDARDSDRQLLFNTLEQFQSINQWITPCRRLFRRHFLAHMLRDKQRRWTLLDIGAGGCDIDRWFVEVCRSSGISVDITCLDNDPRVVEFAREKCQSFEEISVEEGDALQLGPRKWDFVFANHFLHHLSDEQIVDVLCRIDSVAQRGFVISDIHRSLANYAGYSALAAICLRNSFAFYDGRLSIRKSFRKSELTEFQEQSQLSAETVRVQRCPPGHIAIIRRSS